jgi:hypothetical protein
VDLPPGNVKRRAEDAARVPPPLDDGGKGLGQFIFYLFYKDILFILSHPTWVPREHW